MLATRYGSLIAGWYAWRICSERATGLKRRMFTAVY